MQGDRIRWAFTFPKAGRRRPRLGTAGIQPGVFSIAKVVALAGLDVFLCRFEGGEFLTVGAIENPGRRIPVGVAVAGQCNAGVRVGYLDRPSAEASPEGFELVERDPFLVLLAPCPRGVAVPRSPLDLFVRVEIVAWNLDSGLVGVVSASLSPVVELAELRGQLEEADRFVASPAKVFIEP